MVKRAYPDARITLIPNAVDSERFRPATEEQSEEKRCARLLCVARLIQRKGQNHLLEATRLLKNRGRGPIRVVLVGRGDAEATLRAMAHELGLSDWVEFEGYVPREEMPQVYRSADIFVLPSANEGMSVATLEAMASGLPLVVTRASGLEELVNGNGYTFAWGDVKELADVLEKLILSGQLRRKMGERSRQLAQHFSWEEVGRSYVDILASTCGAA
jgi:glycosyltransferase involved in cell wall biosynthesis